MDLFDYEKEFVTIFWEMENSYSMQAMPYKLIDYHYLARPLGWGYGVLRKGAYMQVF